VMPLAGRYVKPLTSVMTAPVSPVTTTSPVTAEAVAGAPAVTVTRASVCSLMLATARRPVSR
jgi:hypothetical protein